MHVQTEEVKPLSLPELDTLAEAYGKSMGYGAQAGDDKLSVEFVEKAELSTFLSNKERRPVVRPHAVCLVAWTDNDQRYNCIAHEVVDGNVHYLSSRFPEAYSRFLATKKAREQGDARAFNIPLTTLALTPVEETSLRYYGFESVQQLAEEDPKTTKIDIKGADIGAIIERAKRVLEAIEGGDKKKVSK